MRHYLVRYLILIVFGAAFSGLPVQAKYMHADPGRAVNLFTPGKISVSLTEPSFEPGQILLPSGRISKDPQVTNIGRNDARVFLKVTIPVREVSLIMEGKKTPKQSTELFSFQVEEHWKYLGEAAGQEEKEYLFCYMQKVLPEQKTTPLFTELITAPYAEGEVVEAEEILVKIEAYAIQWKEEDSMTQAYEKYLNYRGENE